MQWGGAKIKPPAALLIDNGLHFLQGTAGFKDIPGQGVTLPTPNIGIKLENAPGQLQGLLAQVIRGLGQVFQHLHDIPRLQHRADSATHGLESIGDNHLQVQAEAITDVFKQFAQAQGLLHMADLGGGTQRDIDQQVSGTGCNFFRQDGGHHLAF